ncbi:MAG: glycosyltransferase [Candidatus Acidiferrales bacterium]
MKLSVVMITYNHERFIAQAMESALAQKVNFPYEIVIGEDCSTDGTRGIVVDFALRYPERIRPLLRIRNLGMNRNFAEPIAAYRGEYVAFLEGDDYWMSDNKLQRQVDFLDAHSHCAICCTRVQVIDNIGDAESMAPMRPARTYTIDNLMETDFVIIRSTVLRRGLIEPLPHWRVKVKQGDYPLWVMVARHGKIEQLEDMMAAYRVHRGGTWS